jgi:hypothetical protein
VIVEEALFTAKMFPVGSTAIWLGVAVNYGSVYVVPLIDSRILVPLAA